MGESLSLTQKQKYLQFIAPKLSDQKIDKMLEVAFAKKAKPAEEKQSAAYEELMSMVGCTAAKRNLDAMIADYRMREIAIGRGRESPRAYYHAVFSGNPGSAKTTCARLYARALAHEGITKKDSFAELSRSNIIGRYVGHTAPKIREIFSENAGGVIFIDEAYSLCTGEDSRDFGDEAISEIILCLESFPETVVIFAGYPDKMEEFLSMNPGLRSRIPYRVAFEDYSTEELLEISKVIAKEQGGYVIGESAEAKLFKIYEAARKQKDFGNGRCVRNIIEAAVRKKAITLGVMEQGLAHFMNKELYSDEMLFSLDESCFEVELTPTESPRKIGF